MFRDDLAAAHARIEGLERQLEGGAEDTAALRQELAAAQARIAELEEKLRAELGREAPVDVAARARIAELEAKFRAELQREAQPQEGTVDALESPPRRVPVSLAIVQVLWLPLVIAALVAFPLAANYPLVASTWVAIVGIAASRGRRYIRLLRHGRLAPARRMRQRRAILSPGFKRVELAFEVDGRTWTCWTGALPGGSIPELTESARVLYDPARPDRCGHFPYTFESFAGGGALVERSGRLFAPFPTGRVLLALGAAALWIGLAVSHVRQL